MEEINQKVTLFLSENPRVDEKVKELLAWIVEKTTTKKDSTLVAIEPTPKDVPSIVSLQDEIRTVIKPGHRDLLPGEVVICFSAKTGSENATLIAERVVPTLVPIPEGSMSSINEEFLDLVKKAFQIDVRALAILISPGIFTLDYLELVFNRALQVHARVKLVHDQSLVFPSVAEQPEYLRVNQVFHDKAIPFLKGFQDTTAQNMIKAFNKTTSHEDITTRAFLSHKRSSAQGLAGRLFEGLKDYRIFLDTEADFDLHDLQQIVKHTRLFVFILTEGIFDSFWCMQELRSAVSYNIPVVILRDVKFVIPNPFPPELQDIQEIIVKSPTIDYVAEFFNDTVEKLKAIMGPSDVEVAALVEVNPDLETRTKINKEKDIDLAIVVKLPMDFTKVGATFEKLWNYPLNYIRSISLNLDKSSFALDEHFLGAALWHKVTSLSLINYYGNKITDATILEVAAKCKDLQDLNITNNDQITAAGLVEVLKSCKKLRKLDITGCVGLFSDGLSLIAEHCPLLEELNISGFKDGATDQNVSALIKNCKQIKRLNLSGASKLGESFAIGDWSSVEELNLANCSNALTDNCCKVIAQNCKSLKTLITTSCKNFTDEGFVALARNLSLKHMVTDEGLKALNDGIMAESLVHLNLSGGRNITDNGIEHVAKGCKNLQEIILAATTITMKSIEALKSNAKNLKSINTNRCKNIPNAGVMYL